MKHALVLLLALPLLLACARPADQHLLPEGTPVVLISIDTLRADRLPMYGYSAVETPHLDALRADSILYGSAWSHAPLTLPSHVSMLTGLLPPEHGVRNNLGFTFDPGRQPNVPQLLSAAGYATGAAVSSYVMRAGTGLGRAFDHYDDRVPHSAGGAISDNIRSGSETASNAAEWIEQQKAPFFFLLHTYEPHAPYEAPEPFRSRYADPYDAEVAASDAIVGAFLERLKKAGIYDRALIIFTSDHGEGLGDHGESQHGIFLYREAIQVPLLVKLPGAERGETTVDRPVQLIDLAPTILSALGVEPPRPLPGTSLLDLQAPSRTIYSESWYPRLQLGWSEVRSIFDGRHHLIESGETELYDLTHDPREKTDIAADQRRVVSSLRGELARAPEGPVTTERVDPETAAKLSALGYIGSKSDDGKARPSPRRMIGQLESLQKAFQLAKQRRFDDAALVLREITRENPDMIDAWTKLGEVEAEQGNIGESINAYRTALSRSATPAPEVLLAAGRIYLRNRSLDEADSHARAAAASLPADAAELLARTALERGDLHTAEREAARAAASGRPQHLLIVAEVQQRAGRYDQTLATIDRAEESAKGHGGRIAGLEYLRGDTLARMERFDEAANAYEREIEAFPSNIQAYANLAVIRFLQGDRAAARASLGRMETANPGRRAAALAAQTRQALGT